MVKEGVGKGRSDVHVGFQHCYTSPDSASGSDTLVDGSVFKN